jgi:hypothetical protein
MKTSITLIGLFSFILITSCGGSDSGSSTPTISSPSKSVLIAPANNTSCETGSTSSTTQSTVTFSWNSTSNTETYDLKIVNMNTQEVNSQIGITKTTKEVPLTKGVPYSWTITSKNKGTNTTVSETWKFYLGGNGVTNYAPFPASAVSPLQGGVITPANGNLTLRWETSDVEGSPLTYTLYFDTIDGKQSPLETNKNLTAKSKEVSVNPNTVYYWRVVTSDGNNSATSVVYSFKTN